MSVFLFCKEKIKMISIKKAITTKKFDCFTNFIYSNFYTNLSILL